MGSTEESKMGRKDAAISVPRRRKNFLNNSMSSRKSSLSSEWLKLPVEPHQNCPKFVWFGSPSPCSDCYEPEAKGELEETVQEQKVQAFGSAQQAYACHAPCTDPT